MKNTKVTPLTKAVLGIIIMLCICAIGPIATSGETNTKLSASGKLSITAYDTTTSTASVYVKWSAVSKAKSYSLAYRLEGKTWKYVTTSKTSAKLTKLKLHSKYYFKVRAISGKSVGNWSKTYTKYTAYRTPSMVKDLSVTKRYKINLDESAPDYGVAKVALEWSKISYASKYQIKYVQGKCDPAYETVTTNTALVTGLMPYCKVTFQVRAKNGNKYGEWSDEITTYTRPRSFIIDFPETLNVSIKEGLGSLTLSWEITEPKDEATSDYSNIKYRVYCSLDEGEDKEWTLLVKVSSDAGSYKRLRCDKDKIYYFKVVPYDNTSYKTFTVYGKASPIISGQVKTLEGVTIKQYPITENDEYIANRSYNMKGIMLHSVGDNIQSAETWCKKYNSTMKSVASVHGFIDGTTGALWQTLDFEVRAAHAAAAGNDRYIGIEMCESKYLHYEKTKSGSYKVIDDEYVAQNCPTRKDLIGAPIITVKEGHLEDAQNCAKLTYESAVKIFATICDYYGFNPLKKGVIVSHNEWRYDYADISGGGHYDPEHYWYQLGLDYSMTGFRKDVKKILDQYK